MSKNDSTQPANPKNKYSLQSIILLVVLIIIFIAVKIWYSDYGKIYRKHLFVAKKVLHLDFNKLESMKVLEARNKYILNAHCIKDKSQFKFGDFVCAEHLSKWNEIPAANVVFWFKDGILVKAKIDIPPWHHDKFIDYMKKTYGNPHDYASCANIQNVFALVGIMLSDKNKYKVKETINNLGIWKLDSGALLVANLYREIKPPFWSTVLWMSPDTVSEKHEEIMQEK
ncbi:MAG: hypothetical protein JW914_10655 [Syntrophaceae bacterium]|nr:hypothetical protein [Syntrophaceae bacterium]